MAHQEGARGEWTTMTTNRTGNLYMFDFYLMWTPLLFLQTWQISAWTYTDRRIYPHNVLNKHLFFYVFERQFFAIRWKIDGLNFCLLQFLSINLDASWVWFSCSLSNDIGYKVCTAHESSDVPLFPKENRCSKMLAFVCLTQSTREISTSSSRKHGQIECYAHLQREICDGDHWAKSSSVEFIIQIFNSSLIWSAKNMQIKREKMEIRASHSI